MNVPLFAALALAVASCQSSQPPSLSTELRAAAAVLVQSAPSAWPDAADRVFASLPAQGEESGALALIEAVAADEEAPGAQLALGLVGRLGTPSQRRWLEDWLLADRRHAAEAAMALGQLGTRHGTQQSIDPLRRAMTDRDRETVVRTAAAVALFDLGDDAAAVPFMHAVLIAGTPQGQATAERLGLPDRVRWALERNMVIGAVARRTDGDTLGLDAESPWPRLAGAAERFRQRFLGAEGGSE